MTSPPTPPNPPLLLPGGGGGGGPSTKRPKSRGLVQHGSLPGWVEESDSVGVILYVMDGPNCLSFPYHTGPYLYVYAFGEGILLFYETSIFTVGLHFFSSYNWHVTRNHCWAQRQSMFSRKTDTPTIKNRYSTTPQTANQQQRTTADTDNQQSIPTADTQPLTIAIDRQRRPTINRDSYI